MLLELWLVNTRVMNAFSLTLGLCLLDNKCVRFMSTHLNSSHLCIRLKPFSSPLLNRVLVMISFHLLTLFF